MSGVVPGDLGLDSLHIDGEKLDADVAAAVISADVERTIEGASTLRVTLHDAHRRIVESGLLSSRATTQLDGYAFELVQVRKSGSMVETTWEDLAVAALRRHKEPIKVEPDTTTRVEFARRLVAAEPWIELVAPVESERTKVELTQGNPDDWLMAPEDREDTWAALGRIFDEIGWRRFALGKQVWILPETFLFLFGDVVATIREHVGAVDLIDFDYDIGKPVATATVQAHAARWHAGPGSIVVAEAVGPADGRWMVSSIRRSLFSTLASISLAQPRPTLPEPEPPPADDPDAGAVLDGSGNVAGDDVLSGDAPAGTSVEGYRWPMRGRVISPFGAERDGGRRSHEGIDIGAPAGTPIFAARAGTVVAAEGGHGGYGNAVYVNHHSSGGGLSGIGRGGVISQTRYAHLTRIMCRRGQVVQAGEILGTCGTTGNAAGGVPHLHFEVRVGGVARNPMNFMPGSQPSPSTVSRQTPPV